MRLPFAAFVNEANRSSLWLIAVLVVVCTFFSALIPPFQSPDEGAHIERAYLLSKGTIVLDAPEGGASGGMIDSGLIAYASAYLPLQFKPDRKLSSDEIEYAKHIRWTGIKEFAPAPGTGFYFPVIYLPQAIGLAIGETFGLTVDASYQLARRLALGSIAAILFAAFSIYGVNPLTIALLIIPMSIFQFSSASLDGIATALSVFSIAAFLRIATDRENANPWLFYALAIDVVLLATSRVNLLPLLALVLGACFYRKEKKNFLVFALSLLAVLAWQVIAIKTTVGFGYKTGASTSSIVFFYIKHPLRFFDVLLATISNADFVRFYRDSFFGILGWLDTRFSPNIYNFLSMCAVLIGLLSISIKDIRTEWVPRVVLALSAFASIFLIFFALLVTWNMHPASRIEGVQGRYFLVPVIMLAYAISGGLKLHEGSLRKFALLLVVILGAFTISGTTELLVDRYYVAAEQPEYIAVVRRPSAPLDKNNPITLVMLGAHRAHLQPLKRIGIQFATYIRNNPGVAELRLTTPDGRAFTMPFDLPALADNQYKYFDLDPLPYASGEIRFLTGGGISTWEAHEEKGSVATCLIYEYASGAKRYTRGCPRS